MIFARQKRILFRIKQKQAQVIHNKLTKELNNLTKASLVIKQPWEASQMTA